MIKKYFFYLIMVTAIILASGCDDSSTAPKEPTKEELAIKACADGWSAVVSNQYATARGHFSTAMGYNTDLITKASVGYYYTYIKEANYQDLEISIFSRWSNHVNISSVSAQDKAMFALLFLYYAHNTTSGSTWLNNNKTVIYNIIKDAGVSWVFSHDNHELFNGSTAYILCAELLVLKSSTLDVVSVNSGTGTETASANQKYDDFERAHFLLLKRQTQNPLHTLSSTTSAIQGSIRSILLASGFTF